MKDILYIAWQYLSHNRVKTGVLIACITIILALPISLEIILNQSESQLMSRAERTPLIVGAKGSALDLCMNSLYFDDELPDFVYMDAASEIDQSGLAEPVPVYIRFHAREFPIIGTGTDYFLHRDLTVSKGRNFALLGECVIGASVSEQLGLAVDSFIISSPESLFDIAGVYPLKMKITGILAPSYTSDDLGIFTDLKTCWIIEGLGHGHQDLRQINDPTLIYSRNDSVVTATSKLYHYNEITDENMESFHFHGDISGYPITAVLVFPHDEKSGTILMGRYLSDDERYQILKPTEVIDSLLQNIFRIRNVLDAVIAIVGITTLLAMVLVFTLSLRLRQREIQTIFKLGCSKGTIARLLMAEISFIIVISIILTGIIAVVLDQYANGLVRMIFMG
jgi:putative ABC transport system permease protein